MEPIKQIFIPMDHDQIQADLYGDFSSSYADVIIMAHGLGGEKQCGLDYFAQYYQTLGYHVCVFDHRGFGQSTGPTKYLVDKNSQIDDWKTVIQYIKDQFKFKNHQIILWGYSFSGAHALTLASTTPFKAVIANFPHVDGLASLPLYPKKFLLPATLIALQDIALSKIGKVKTMPIVAKNRFAVLAGEDCYDGYNAIIPEHVAWENEVPARIIATIGLYRPIQVAHKIQIPTLVIGAKNDSLIPIEATRKTAKKIPLGTYFEENCGHFDLFHEPYRSQILKEHVDFLANL